jgi:hypothetical protein
MLTKQRQFIVGVAAVLALGLLLAPLTAYANRQRVLAEEVQAVPGLAASVNGRRTSALTWHDLLAMCYQRATAADPSDLVGTWSCAGYALPGHRAVPEPVYDATSAQLTAVPVTGPGLP